MKNTTLYQFLNSISFESPPNNVAAYLGLVHFASFGYNSGGGNGLKFFELILEMDYNTERNLQLLNYNLPAAPDGSFHYHKEFSPYYIILNILKKYIYYAQIYQSDYLSLLHTVQQWGDTTSINNRVNEELGEKTNKTGINYSNTNIKTGSINNSGENLDYEGLTSTDIATGYSQLNKTDSSNNQNFNNYTDKNTFIQDINQNILTQAKINNSYVTTDTTHKINLNDEAIKILNQDWILKISIIQSEIVNAVCKVKYYYKDLVN